VPRPTPSSFPLPLFQLPEWVVVVTKTGPFSPSVVNQGWPHRTRRAGCHHFSPWSSYISGECGLEVGVPFLHPYWTGEPRPEAMDLPSAQSSGTEPAQEEMQPIRKQT
jgi:hypothetical protein